MNKQSSTGEQTQKWHICLDKSLKQKKTELEKTLKIKILGHLK